MTFTIAAIDFMQYYYIVLTTIIERRIIHTNIL